MRALEDLRQKLLFNSLFDTWKALCEERGWEWADPAAYLAFEEHVLGSGLWSQPAGVCALDEEEEAAFLEAFERHAGRPLRTVNIRLDEEAVAVVRAFAP